MQLLIPTMASHSKSFRHTACSIENESPYVKLDAKVMNVIYSSTSTLHAPLAPAEFMTCGAMLGATTSALCNVSQPASAQPALLVHNPSQRETLRCRRNNCRGGVSYIFFCTFCDLIASILRYMRISFFRR